MCTPSAKGPPEIRLLFGKMKKIHYFNVAVEGICASHETFWTGLRLNANFNVDCVNNEDCFLSQCDEEYSNMNIIFTLF